MCAFICIYKNKKRVFIVTSILYNERWCKINRNSKSLGAYIARVQKKMQDLSDSTSTCNLGQVKVERILLLIIPYS